MTDGLGGVGDLAKGANDVLSDGAHYLRLHVLEPLELFPFFFLPPFFFLAPQPELESLMESAAFWAGAFFFFDFFLVGGGRFLVSFCRGTTSR